MSNPGIAERGVSALRNGAALVRLVPQLRLRLRVGDRIVAEVGRPPFQLDGPPQVPACLFHRSVAELWARVPGAAAALPLPAFEAGDEPAVDVGVAPGDAVLPGGMVRVAVNDRWVHMLALAHGEAALPPATTADLELHHDQAVGVTVVCALTPARDKWAAAAAVDRISEVAGATAVAGLERMLRQLEHPSANPDQG